MIRTVGCAVLMLCVPGCGPDPVSDTGYTGTWVRGNDRLKSTLAIVERQGEYRVRRSLRSADGSHELRCDWDGKCEEFVDGEKTSDYTLRPSVDAETKRLRLEVRASIFKPTVLELHYVDEFLLKDEGLRLRARTIEKQGQPIRKKDGPVSKRDYRKVSNRVTDPPDGWSADAG